MRLRWPSLLLAFCLVFSQQGALLHEMRHELPHAGATPDDEAQRPAGVGCSMCLAFAHIVGVVGSTVAPLPLVTPEYPWSAEPGAAHRPADAPPASARDPPTAS